MLLLVCPGALAEKLKFACSDVESATYLIGNGEQMATPPGAMVDVMNQVAQELGFEIEYVRLPVNRLLKKLQMGEVDGAFSFSFNEDRLQYGQFPMKGEKDDPSLRFLEHSYVFYKLKSSPFNWDGTAVSGLGTGVVGFNTTFSVGVGLAKLGIPVEQAKTTEQNFKKLMLGRIAVFAMQEHTGDMYLWENQITGVEKVETPFERKPYYLMLSKQLVQRDPALAQRIWARLAKVRDGKMAKFQRNYLP